MRSCRRKYLATLRINEVQEKLEKIIDFRLGKLDNVQSKIGNTRKSNKKTIR